MWNVRATELFALRTPGGDVFTAFVDALIRAQCGRAGIPDSEIHTNIRTNIADGGADTSIYAAIPSPQDPTGYFGVPTCWQYKAGPYKSITDASLKEEINKPHAAKLIREGYGYRLAVCDDMPDAKKRKWQKLLATAARKIDKNAPKPIVLTASALTAWTSRFPSLVIRFFRDGLADFLDLTAWKDNVCSVTPIYVPVPAWDPIAKRLAAHLDLHSAVVEPVFRISGDAGVGKSRMVFEAVSAHPTAAELTLRAQSCDAAERLVTWAAHDRDVRAILVVDECPLEQIVRLNKGLMGCRDRVRVVAIDNASNSTPSGAPLHGIKAMDDSTVSAILERNFPAVPRDRQRRYVELSRGFVLFAADLCRHDHMLGEDSALESSGRTVSDYLCVRLDDSQLTALKACSLLTKVRYRSQSQETGVELNDLCTWLNINADELRKGADRTKDSTGFIRRAADHYCVTPELIARVAFSLAWDDWAISDPGAFLRKLPTSLVRLFLDRASRSTDRKEVKDAIASHFRDWARTLAPAALRDAESNDRLCALVESSPEEYVPLLREILEGATTSEVRQITGEWDQRWGPRRQLVWRLERLAAFPELFEDVEACLFRLAQAESEPGIGNNATAIWEQLHRLHLSGTALPFEQRFPRLRDRLFSEPSELVFNALAHVLQAGVMRTVGPAVVGGRIPPEEWNPRVRQDELDAETLVLGAIEEAARRPPPQQADRMIQIALGMVRGRLCGGHLDRLRRFFAEHPVADRLPQLHQGIEHFLEFDAVGLERTKEGGDYIARVRAWLGELAPTSIHDRVVALVGRTRWLSPDISVERQWHLDLEALARELVANQEAFARELEWLTSDAAVAAVHIGEALARCDPGGAYLDRLFAVASTRPNFGIVRGYVHGILRFCEPLLARVNALFDSYEVTAPEFVFHSCVSGGSRLHAVERAVRLLRAGGLPPAALRYFAFGPSRRDLSSSQLTSLLGALLVSARSGDAQALATAVDLANEWLEDATTKGARALAPAQSEPLSLIFEILGTAADRGGGEAYLWGRVLQALVKVDCRQVAAIAARALVGEGFGLHDQALGVLSELASVAPEVTLEELARMILSAERSWVFFVRKFAGLFGFFPTALVKDWVQKHGVELAQCIARHLPAPRLDNGTPVVPEITEFVLTKFAKDDRVFNEFCAGVHSGQSYVGDIAAAHEAEAEIARKFLNHRLPRIREWARLELEARKDQADYWRRKMEEDSLPQ